MKLKSYRFSAPWSWGNPPRWVLDYQRYEGSGIVMITVFGCTWMFIDK